MKLLQIFFQLYSFLKLWKREPGSIRKLWEYSFDEPSKFQDDNEEFNFRQNWRKAGSGFFDTHRKKWVKSTLWCLWHFWRYKVSLFLPVCISIVKSISKIFQSFKESLDLRITPQIIQYFWDYTGRILDLAEKYSRILCFKISIKEACL